MIHMEALPAIQSGTLHFPGGYGFINESKAFIITQNGNTAIIDESILESLLKGVVPSESRPHFLQRGILEPIQPSTSQRSASYFIIDLVKNCNFNCIYCFRDLQDKRVISVEVLDDILCFIKEYCEDKKLYRIGLQMWGGEPLLALDRIEHVVSYFRNSKIASVIDIETNGSLVTDDVARRLHEMGIRVGVSIDGTPRFQNRQRPYINGAPTAMKIEEGICNLQKYYKDALGGITVITKHNYRHIKEMLDYYIFHLKMRSLKFNVVRDNPNATAGNLSLDKQEVTWFANELLDCLFAYRSIGKSFSEGNIDVRVKNLLHQCNDNLCISRGCQGGKRILSFNQKGELFPCEMTDFAEEKIGSIYSGCSLDEMISNAEHKNLFFVPKEKEKCGSCPWWCYCRGGCTSRNRYIGLIGRPDECECTLNRVIYPRIVEGIMDGTIGG